MSGSQNREFRGGDKVWPAGKPPTRTFHQTVVRPEPPHKAHISAVRLKVPPWRPNVSQYVFPRVPLCWRPDASHRFLSSMYR
jgi:hypothetical protein